MIPIMWRAVILSGIAIAADDEEFLARHRIVPPRIVADLVDEPQSRLKAKRNRSQERLP